MMSLRVLVPDATINYVTNPALRYDTTGWNAQGSTITRTLEQARFGIASLKVVTAGSAQREGCYFRVSSLSGVSEAITVSIYVRGAGKVRVRLDNNVVGGAEYFSQSMVLESSRWKRIEVTGFSTGGNDLRLYVETDEGSAKVRTFYVDGAQMERKAYATSYCDGDQPGCRWSGLYHGSTSQREANTRAGGKWVQLAGEEREAEDLYMTVAGGLGVAPIRNNTQSFALAPGGYFENNKIGMRVITLTFFAKHVVEDNEAPVSLSALHQLRQLLIDLVKPDLTGGNEDIWFEYFDGTIPLYFQARYDGGLEGEWDVRNQFVNSFPLRLLAVGPMMEEDSQEAQELDFQDTFTMNYVAARINGRWDRLNYGFDNQAWDFARGPKGEVYVYGHSFTVVNNNAAAIDPLRPTRGPVYWDGEKWVKIATSMTLSGVNEGCVAVAPNGDVYAGGDFTLIDGVAATRIAKYSAGTWSALGSGLNATCRDIAIAPNGDVYAVGDFTTAGGVNCFRVARWDGYQWRRVGQFGGVNGIVRTIVITEDGSTLYIGGDFTTEQGGGQTLTRVASYNIASGMFAPMSSGLSAAVYRIIITNSILYAAGDFTLISNPTPADSYGGVATWNGNSWNTVGGSMTVDTASGLSVREIEADENGNLYAAGVFVKAGGKTIKYFANWNGSNWINMDIVPAMPVSISTFNPRFMTLPNGVVFLKGLTSGSALISAINTITNPGSAEIRPVVYCLGPGTVRRIENQTTRKGLYLDLILQNQEEVFIDFGKGTIESTIRGSLLYAMLPGSDFRSFTLIPGENKIACFMVDDVNAKMTIQFGPQHWGVDATG